jgi:hypothetical protein
MNIHCVHGSIVCFDMKNVKGGWGEGTTVSQQV